MTPIRHIGKNLNEKDRQKRTTPAVSDVLPDGSILETVYDPTARKTSFALWRDNRATFTDTCEQGSGPRLVPYSPENNLIRHQVVLLPERPEGDGEVASLVADLQAYIHRYVDLTPLFETLAAYYALFSWVHDAFHELPYLRVRGEPGCGKTRFLEIVGAVCYKPFFASGASTTSPIFRILDAFRGTLVIDESDFRVSDEKAEIIKILNNGNVSGFPVLRSESTRNGEFNPRAFHVFGPKLIATRREFADDALETRCLTEDMGSQRLRPDIPINLPRKAQEEANSLRNRLLMFRFRHFHRCAIDPTTIDPSLEPRLNQIFAPLLSLIDDSELRTRLHRLLKGRHDDLKAGRGMNVEGQILEVIDSLRRSQPNTGISIGGIAERFQEIHGDDYQRPITARWIGWNLRKRLNIRTERVAGSYSIAASEKGKLDRLFDHYGIGESPDRPPDEKADAMTKQDFEDFNDISNPTPPPRETERRGTF